MRSCNLSDMVVLTLSATKHQYDVQLKIETTHHRDLKTCYGRHQKLLTTEQVILLLPYFQSCDMLISKRLSMVKLTHPFISMALSLNLYRPGEEMDNCENSEYANSSSDSYDSDCRRWTESALWPRRTSRSGASPVEPSTNEAKTQTCSVTGKDFPDRLKITFTGVGIAFPAITTSGMRVTSLMVKAGWVGAGVSCAKGDERLSSPVLFRSCRSSIHVGQQTQTPWSWSLPLDLGLACSFSVPCPMSMSRDQVSLNHLGVQLVTSSNSSPYTFATADIHPNSEIRAPSSWSVKNVEHWS